MSKSDAENVLLGIEYAKEHLKPLKEPALEKKLDEVSSHILKKLDPKKGG